MTDNKFYLSKPLESEFPYILTKQSRQDIINDYKENIDVLRICIVIFGAVGVITGGYCLFKLYKAYKEKKQREEMAANLRQERLRRIQQDRNNGASINNNNVEQTCVLCLVNQREIVLLDCGHFCLCLDCLELLPNTNCPICRQPYQSYARCYVP